MFQSLIIFTLLSWSCCYQISTRKQQIFDDVLKNMTASTGCVDHTEFFKNLYKTLAKEMIIAEVTQIQRWIFDDMIGKHNIQRRWYSIDGYQNQICFLDQKSPKLYGPTDDFTSPKLSVKDTLARYPYLRNNMQHQKITKLLMALPSSFRQSFQIRRYTIIDKKLYIQSFQSNLDPNHYAKYFIPHLNDLPDMDFIMSGKYELLQRQFVDHARKNSRSLEEYIGKIQWYKRIFIELPMFLLHKSLSNNIQFNKFLVPGTESLSVDWWNGLIGEIDEGARIYSWENKIEKAYYRSGVSGVLEGHDQISNNIPIYFTRLHLVNISRHNPDLVEAEFAGDQSYWNHLIIKTDFKFLEEKVQQLSFKDMQKYKYLISMDAWVASTRKAALILRSNSVLFKQMGEKVQWYFDKLIPNYHFIALSRTVDDVLDKVRYMRENDNLAKQIVVNANQFFKQYLTPASSDKHLVQILKDYAEIQQLKLGYFEKKLYTQKNMTRMEDRRDMFLNYYSYLWSVLIVVFVCLVSALLILASPFGGKIQDIVNKNKKKLNFSDNLENSQMFQRSS